MSTPINAAGAVRREFGVNTAERFVHYEMPEEKTQQRKRQGAVSSLNVRSGQMQSSNAGNTLLLSETPFSDYGNASPSPSRPFISGSEVGASTAQSLKQPTSALFHNLLEMSKLDFFGNDNKKIAQALQGFDINIPVENNMTMLEAALIAAAESLDGITVVQTLIEMGARFDLVAPDRSGVLRGAIKSGNVDLVKSLISRGKGKNSEEMHQALHYAILQCEPKLALAVIKSMRGIDSSLLNVTDLLSRAVTLNDLELVRQICGLAGPDINKPGSDGSTVLAYAATYMSAPDIIEFLISSGAAVNGTGDGARNNALVAALIGINKKRLDSLDDEEIRLVKQRKLQTFQKILVAENVSIDFDIKIAGERNAAITLFGLAANAGPEFVTCLAEAQLRQASRRIDLPSSAKNFKH